MAGLLLAITCLSNKDIVFTENDEEIARIKFLKTTYRGKKIVRINAKPNIKITREARTQKNATSKACPAEFLADNLSQ